MKSYLGNFVVALCIILSSADDAVEDLSKHRQLANITNDFLPTPTLSPTGSPNLSPSAAPSNVPSVSPNASPSSSPSFNPSNVPSSLPTSHPSDVPSAFPSMSPSSLPSIVPTHSSMPTATPSSAPSTVPTMSSMPSSTPTLTPSTEPTVSAVPSATPTSSPSSSPTASAEPSSFPSVNLEGLTEKSAVFEAVKDTYIIMGSNETFGNSTGLRVDADPKCITLIKFDISSLNGGTDQAPLSVHGATLRMNALTGSEFGGSVSVYYNLDFNETDANADSDGSWTNLTETYENVAQFGTVIRDKAYSVDIINAFRKRPLPATFSVRITSDIDDGVDWSSIEGIKGPRVIFDIAYDPADQSDLAETFGTDEPTQSPTITKTWENNPVPSNPPARYFNYDPTSDYGPNRWRKGKGTTDLRIWENLKTDRTTNKCGSGTLQSPRDLCGDQTTHACDEKHEIRRAKGDFGLTSGKVPTPIAEIKPHKLSLRFPERSCCYQDKDVDKREYPNVPRADFSMNGFNSGAQPLIFLDIKTKSEHKICGKRYDVELQYIYLHWYGRLEAAAVLGEVDEELTIPNRTFQQILNFFQKKANKDKNACKEKQRRARALFRASKEPGKADMSDIQDELGSTDKETDAILPFGLDDDVQETASSKNTLYHNIKTRFLNLVEQRDLRSSLAVNFYDPDDIWHSEWFIGYQGSLTFPPCSENVRWRIMDVPFKITKGQLRQLRNIQFEHVDPNTCKLDSVHYNESNARPTKRYKGGKYYRCTHRDYPSDEEREESGRRTGFPDQSKWYGSDKRPWMQPFEGLSST